MRAELGVVHKANGFPMEDLISLRDRQDGSIRSLAGDGYDLFAVQSGGPDFVFFHDLSPEAAKRSRVMVESVELG